MGGGSSRYEETDWPASTGKLLSEAETVDGRPPTRKHGVYTITKQGINQRDFEVVDEDCNLIYTTQCIEGTLAWFDVLGQGLDNYLLRVQVDLSRRYWIVYRYEKPSYTGQFPDMYATMKLREVRGEDAPCLYKQASITVSWSRYYAIVHRFGPPIASEILSASSSSMSLASMEDGKIKAFADEIESNSLGRSNAEADTQDKKNAGDNNDEIEQDNGIESGVNHDSYVQKGVNKPSTSYANSIEERSSVEAGLPFEAPRKVKAHPKSTSYQLLSTKEMLESVNESAMQSHILVMKQWKEWAKKSAGMDQPPPNPLEGQLLVHEPILKCEEVNSFMGQHQTMLISSEEAEKLEEADLRAASKQGTDSHNPDGVLHSPATHSTQKQAVKVPSIEGEIEKPSFPRIKKFGEWLKQQSSKILEVQDSEPMKKTSPLLYSDRSADPTERRNDLHDDNSVLAQDRTDETKDSRDYVFVHTVDKPSHDDFMLVAQRSILEENSVSAYHGPTSQLPGGFQTAAPNYVRAINEAKNAVVTVVDHDTTMNTEGEKADIVPTRDLTLSSASNEQPLEPLVGYWIWDNTMQIHKMKMTVAKDSDLALHVVLAVVTNQLRLERNVILTTV